MTDRVINKIDRVECGKYMLFVNRPSTLTDIIAYDRSWFIIKNLSNNVDVDIISAWADMWVSTKHLGCEYDEFYMKILESMEKELFV